MKLTVDDVEHIARLARLDLSDAEKERYTTELSAILSYAEILQEVDTTGVAPTSHITDELAVLRPDVAIQCDDVTRARLIGSFPQSKADLLTVAPVFSSYKQ